MLRNEIEDAKRAVTTDTVSISIGEVASMYTSSELNILPEFQRLFRWTIDRKSNFVESILIGIPIPPVFVYENENGTWELIDGLQRISTLLEFMGVLKDPDSGGERRSVLTTTKYLSSLEGMAWKAQNEAERSLDIALQLFFRRHRIDFQILKHPSDPKTKFDLFQRLNRGGAYANEQEVRTCSMVLANADITRRLRELCATEPFKRIFRITEEQRSTQKDLEFAVRVTVHSRVDLPKQLDVQEFLDQSIIDVMTRADANSVVDDVIWGVSKLHRLLGDDALIPPNDRIAGIAPRFSLRALEGIAAGLIRNRVAIEALSNSDEYIIERVKQFWLQPEAVEMSTAGLRGTVRLQRSVPFGTSWFNPNV